MVMYMKKTDNFKIKKYASWLYLLVLIIGTILYFFKTTNYSYSNSSSFFQMIFSLKSFMILLLSYIFSGSLLYVVLALVIAVALILAMILMLFNKRFAIIGIVVLGADMLVLLILGFMSGSILGVLITIIPDTIGLILLVLYYVADENKSEITEISESNSILENTYE